MTNAEIRTNLLKYLQLFNSNNCQYNFDEAERVKDLQEVLQPVKHDLEAFNEKHPDHGGEATIAG